MITETQTELDELPGGLALAVAVKEGKWPHTLDAQEWARQFLAHVQEKPSIATDEGTMIGWFANAIMAGHDGAQMAARVDADDSALRYTKELPNASGFYWRRFPGEVTGDVVSVLLSDKGYEAKDNLGWALVDGVYCKGSEWAGPIETPKD